MPKLMVIKAQEGQNQTYTGENVFLDVNDDDLLWIQFEKLKLDTETDEKLLKITKVQEIINKAKEIGQKLGLDAEHGIFVNIDKANPFPENWQYKLQQLINQQLQATILQVPEDPSKYAEIEPYGDKFKLKLKTPQRQNSQIDLHLTAKQQSLLQSIQKFFPDAALTKISSSTPARVGIVGDAKETNKQAWELILNNADSTEVYKFHLSGEDYKNASIYETDGSPLEHIKSDADGKIDLEKLINENEANVITELQRIARLVILAVATGRDTITLTGVPDGFVTKENIEMMLKDNVIGSILNEQKDDFIKAVKGKKFNQINTNGERTEEISLEAKVPTPRLK